MLYIFRAIWRALTLTLFLAGLVLTPQVWLVLKVLEHAGEGAIAEYRLRMIPPAEYDAQIAAALDQGDGDLARSLVALAADQKIAVEPALLTRLGSLPAVDIGNVLRQGWDCVASGDFESEAGLACVVATDLTGIGDARDLAGEGTNYLTGRPVNYLTLGIATVGLGLTVSTFMSLGAALPVKAGVSFLKGMNKIGKLPPRLAAEVGLLLSRSIDKAALAESVNLAREFRIGELGGPLSRLFRPKSIAAVGDLAADFGTIGKVGGVRAMKLSAEAAEGMAEVKVAARTAERFQGKFLGVMKLLGHGALRLADLMLTFAGWLIGAVLWLIGIALFLMRTARRVARLIYVTLRWSVRGVKSALARPVSVPALTAAAAAG